MNKVDVRKLGLEGKNEFLSFFNVYSYKYNEILDKLGYGDLDNLVEVVRNKIYSLAEGYEVEGEYFFYTSISGDIIISMFESIILEEYNKMTEAYEKLENKSEIGRYFYYTKRNNWLLEYEALIEFCANFKVENVEDKLFECFYTIVNKKEFLKRKDEYIKSFKIELIYLAKCNQARENFDKYLVKKIGDK